MFEVEFNLFRLFGLFHGIFLFLLLFFLHLLLCLLFATFLYCLGYRLAFLILEEFAHFLGIEEHQVNVVLRTPAAMAPESVLV